jgi:toxin YoeB
VSEWRVVFTKQARKDAPSLAAAGLRGRAEALIEILRQDPFQSPPPFERLVGDLAGAYSRRINIQHRLVYQVVADERTVKVLRMWTHYE